MKMGLPFSMVITWSDVDQVYIAHLEEFGSGAKTHGSTYEEAAKNGREVLEMLVESYIADGQPLPKPQTYSGSTAARAKMARRKASGKRLRSRAAVKTA